MAHQPHSGCKLTRHLLVALARVLPGKAIDVVIEPAQGEAVDPQLRTLGFLIAFTGVAYGRATAEQIEAWEQAAWVGRLDVPAPIEFD